MPPITELGWIQACPPDSPARLNSPTYPPSPTPFHSSTSSKTFIASHKETMDPCMNPALLTTHGQFLSYNTGPFAKSTLIPHFSLCATLLHHDIRPPVPYGWKFNSDSDEGKQHGEDGAFEGDVPWERKVNERLGWRGRTTGMYASSDKRWENGHRARLVTLTNALEGNASVLHVPTNKKGVESGDDAEAIPVGESEIVPLAQVNPAWMDVAFTERPIACDEDDGTCTKMAHKWSFQETQEREEEGRYKFIIDVRLFASPCAVSFA